MKSCFAGNFLPCFYHKKKPRTDGAGRDVKKGGRARPSSYICVMSRSLVSGRKIRPTTKLIAATTIGYHRPE